MRRAAKVALVVLLIILGVVFLPFVPQANSSYTSCRKSGCATESKYGSPAYIFLGWGGVYDTGGSYSLGSPSKVASQNSTLASSISADGLQLVLVLNTTKIHNGSAIAAQAYVLNTRGTNTSFPVRPNPEIEGCSLSSNLVGYAVFSGHFDEGNISMAGKPLYLAAPIVTYCPAVPFPNRLVFLPYSDNAAAYFSHATILVNNGSLITMAVNVTTQTCVSLSTGWECGMGTSLNGYWNTLPIFPQPNPSMFKYFEHFQPGYYTIVAADAWNQTIYAGFIAS